MGNTSIFFSANPLDWTQLEGVYVDRQKPQGQIVGESVNTVALVGQTLRGPTGKTLVTSPSQFLATFGDRDNGGGGVASNKLWLAMLNRTFSFPLYVSRAVATAAAVGTVNLQAAAVTIVTANASSKGAWSNNASNTGVGVAVVAASDGVGTHWDLVVYYQGNTVARYRNLNTSAGNDNTAAVIGSDPSNLIVLSKIADGRPDNTTGSPAIASLASGSDGTIAASDYITALDLVANANGIDIVVVAENAVTQATLNAEIVRLAPLNPLKIFCTWDGAYASPTSEVTNVGTQIATKARNIFYCSNTSHTNDPKTGGDVETGTHLDMAAILSQTFPDIHPGDEDNVALLAGLTHLTNESLERGDLISLRAAGISTLEKTDTGFRFHSGVATDGSEITDVRCEAFLVKSISDAVKYDVRKPFTQQRMADMKAKVVAFLMGLQNDNGGRVVDQDQPAPPTGLGPAFKVAFVQTASERAANLGKLLIQVRLISHLNYLVLMTDISTGTTVVAS
jgi:hypothetical protein